MTSDTNTADEAIAGGAVFDAVYYATGCGKPYSRNDHWLNFFGGIADEIVRSLRPTRVFDAGCAMGMLVESLWDRGVQAWGADISSFSIGSVRPDMQAYCRLASITEPFGGTFDLITCIEVLEHIPEKDAWLAVEQMTSAAGTILFSSTPDDFTEPTHINVHPILYWLNLFERYGFEPDLIYDAGFVAPHAILFRKATRPSAPGVLLLFAEKLRLKIALVRREQRLGELELRIGGFEQRIRDLNDALSASTSELRDAEAGYAETRRADQARFAAEIDAASAKSSAMLRDAESKIAELTAEKLTLQGAAAALESEQLETARRQRDLEQALNVARRDAARFRGELDAVRIQAFQANERAVALETNLNDLRNRTGNLANTAAVSRARLAEIENSPGWRAILRYRQWFGNLRTRHRWVDRWFEPAAARLLRRFDSSGSIAPPDVAERAAAEQQAVGLPQTLSYHEWIGLTEPSWDELELQRQISVQFAYRPKIGILVPAYRSTPEVLKDTLQSVLDQTYDNWEVCLATSDSPSSAAGSFLAALADSDDRIKVEFLEANLGISGNSNRALALCTGEFVALLDHDDILAPFALFEVVQLLNQSPRLDFIYSDKDHISEDGAKRLDPLFKPRWSPDIMLSANYLTHLCVLRTEVVRAAGGWLGETDGAQDWDLFLRAIDNPDNVAHIPKVLYHWRKVHSSVASRGLEAKPYAAEAQLRTIRAHLERRGYNADPAFTSSGLVQLHWRWTHRPKITVVVISDTSAMDTSDYAARILPRAKYADVELLSVHGQENISGLAAALNEAVRRSSGDVLVFLDRGIEVGAETWLDELVAPLQQPGIGVVGSKLFSRETSRIVHAGICFNANGELGYPFANETDYIYNAFGGANWYRDWLAVSGACFSVRRDVFDEAGGFAAAPAFPRLDVDLCLKIVLVSGRRVFYNPFARMWQTRDAVIERWLDDSGAARGSAYIASTFPEGDPFFNPNLVVNNGTISFGVPADRRAPADQNFAAEARALVQAFDCTPGEIRQSIASCRSTAGEPIRHVMWFIPEFHHAFYGGIHTLLRFADHFRRKHNVRSSFVVLGHAHPSSIEKRIALVSPELASASAIHVIDSYTALANLETTDVAIATLWNTAYYVLRYNQARQKVLFIQDHESLFYPAGSTSALADATWGFGFRAICNTVTLRDLYTARGGDAEYFNPCVDRDVFFPPSARERREDRPLTLFCYARPRHSRNCFELIVETIKIVKRNLGDRVTIVTAGEQWDPRQFGLEGLVHNLGVLGYRTTGALYRTCDAGIAVMTTAHPSYLPLELMACGSLVIANENPATSWLLQDGVNCLLAPTTPRSLAEAVEKGLLDPALRERLVENAAQMIADRFEDWGAAADKVFHYLSQ